MLFAVTKPGNVLCLFYFFSLINAIYIYIFDLSGFLSYDDNFYVPLLEQQVIATSQMDTNFADTRVIKISYL